MNYWPKAPYFQMLQGGTNGDLVLSKEITIHRSSEENVCVDKENYTAGGCITDWGRRLYLNANCSESKE